MTSGFVHGSGCSNEELLNRCRQNDETALRELLRRHEKPVYGLLFRILGSHEDAEEALADVFIKVWRAAGSFRGGSKFTTWLYRIANNTARDVLRSRKTRPEIVVDDSILSDTIIACSTDPDPETAMINGCELARIEVAIQRLPEDDRRLISLYHMQELSLEEITEITGISRTNLKVKLFRARVKLRAHLADLDREINDEVQAGTIESAGLEPGSAEST